ncbi:hypothetical protein SAY87_026581 [Trapa incisa]|uniref:Uncharacterized protein n=1 Tax=Trapa incisa TaxID=236973 RepID=A0AAN7GY21_9MYRT|nr:hypothetical protein SAY87_026581 [Trapa incisa]
MDNQISRAKAEAVSQKEILDKVEKWMSACEEESWLEDYNRNGSRSMSKDKRDSRPSAPANYVVISKDDALSHVFRTEQASPSL